MKLPQSQLCVEFAHALYRILITKTEQFVTVKKHVSSFVAEVDIGWFEHDAGIRKAFGGQP